MGACISSHARHDENRRSTTLDDAVSPLGPFGLGSRRWKRKKRYGKSQGESRRNSGVIDFGLLPKGGSVGEDELHRIPGRMFVNGASEVACLFTQQGKKGTNQDAMLVWENFASQSDTVFCGVFDGHGPFGHMVAKKVRDSLPLKVCAHWKAAQNDVNGLKENSSVLGSMSSEETASISLDDEWSESLEVEENEKLPEMYITLKQSLLKAFKLMDKELKLHPTIDCFCSGTTAVTLVKQDLDLVIGNVGDSRAVLGMRDKDNSLVAVQLTVDLKPNLPREAARIQQCKGRVFALQDEPEVARVWLPNNDSPGLAMARAFGDFCLKDFGLISVPDISYRRLTSKDEFIVLATDGVWDVLSNKEVVDIVASAPSRATAARAVVDCAVRAWRLKFPTSKSDDCAVVCLFLDPPSLSPEVEESTLGGQLPEEPVSDATVHSSTENEKEEEKPQHLVTEEGLAEHSASNEIVPASELREAKMPDRCHSTRSLAECISTAEDEEWSALEGVTRVNSLLNLPRFGSGDRKAVSWRKWL
ncbi:probable protein phosphatase 2C 66 [Aristolochia californica]|uniref:probable protein phosphatase 2C 66 n=1 Tax=Aristolochia californica TaxID=171875 RepID=UPI0035E3A336